jgi:hypothetical protein
MRFLSLRIHAALDHLTVLAFALAPAVLGFEGLMMYICYGLASAHTLVTMLSPEPVGSFGVLPEKWHAGIELAVAFSLGLGNWALPISSTGHWFLTGSAGVIFLLWLVTDYDGKAQPALMPSVVLAQQ